MLGWGFGSQGGEFFLGVTVGEPSRERQCKGPTTGDYYYPRVLASVCFLNCQLQPYMISNVSSDASSSRIRGDRRFAWMIL